MCKKQPYRIYNFQPNTCTFTVDMVNRRPANTSSRPTGTMLAYTMAIFDQIHYFIQCKIHRKYLLKQFYKNYYFLPYYPFKLFDSWDDVIMYYLELILKSIGFTETICTTGSAVNVKMNLLQWTQVKMTRFADHLHQLVIQVELGTCAGTQCSSNGNDNNGGNGGGGQKKEEFKWFTPDQLNANGAIFWGPEPYQYHIRLSSTPSSSPSNVRCIELSTNKELRSQTKKWDLLRSLDYTETDVGNMFDEFIQHCYPSLCMNQTSFNCYLSYTNMNLTVNSPVHDAQRLYNSFCITNNQCITFKDFVLTLAALEKRCVHGSIGGELRTRCIFKYYTKIGSNGITFQEMVQLNQDIIKTNKRNIIDDAQKCTEQLYKSIGYGSTPDRPIAMEKFVELVGCLTIRGTASVFRATSGSPLAEFRLKKFYSSLALREVDVEKVLCKKRFPGKPRKYCRACTRPVYSMAIHSFNVDANAGLLVGTQAELLSDVVNKIVPKALRDPSRELIGANSTNIYNELRQCIRKFCAVKFDFPRFTATEMKEIERNNDNNSWESRDYRMSLCEKIMKICLDAKELHQKLPRVSKIQSPVYVFGDIHGNLKDLMIYDHLFWRMAPVGFVGNALFLGDYVDRGDDSVECVLYLLCMKLMLPHKFTILRGNHESRPIQQQFTFYRECLDKFSSMGNSIWEAFNQVFDSLPVCGVIDEQIYCAHGGIPATYNRIECLYDIPCPMPNANLQSKVAWEILWNDPVTKNEYKEFMELFHCPDSFPDYPRGFIPNLKRGTAFYYSEDAIDSFLEVNDLQYVIRGHEVIPNGFLFHMDGKMMTIFSCSNYCGANNESAVVYVEGGKLRIIKIETNQKFE